MPSLLRRSLLPALAGLVTATTLPVHAGSVTVAVTDAAGRPLADAVVLLEPTAGKAAVKPMTGVEIAQAKRQFQPRVTLVTVGSRVNFPNFDTVRHHVYSFSPVKKFEIKLYVGTPAAPVVFDSPGIAVLGCNIHDQMAAWVVVLDTPYFARTGADGRATLPAAPPGSYRLRAWHAALPPGTAASDMALKLDTAPVKLDVALAEARP